MAEQPNRRDPQGKDVSHAAHMRGGTSGTMRRNTRQDGAPVFSVQDEIRRDRRVRRAGQYRRAKRRTAPLVAVLLCVLLCLALLGGAAALLLRVETVEVNGNVRYTDGEILEASGIRVGDSMLFIRRDKLFRKIAAVCPHVEQLELEKNYPSSVIIRVTETGAVYFTRVRDRICTLDASLRVIECTDATDGLIELRLPEVKSAIEGSALVFADAEDDTRVRAALDVLGEADDVLALDCIDLRDRYNIAAYAAGRAEVLFGDAAKLDVKLRIARRVYADALAESSSGTRIDVSEPSRVSVSYDQVINYSKE